MASQHSASPHALTNEDRHHGRLALLLFTSWHDWVKRRVESVQFVNSTTVVRRVSIDFRIRSWLPDPVLEWDGVAMHYLPIALLEKGPLIAFDVRDEAGDAIPLLTRRKNAAIAAGALVAAAQFSIAHHIRQAASIGPEQSDSPLPSNADVRSISLPPELEEDLWRLAYLNYDPGSSTTDAGHVLESFYAPPAVRVAAPAWRWEQDDAGCWQPIGIHHSVWKWELMADRNFRDLAADFARLFMITVPVADQRRRRRILKFRYQHHLREPQLRVISQAKSFGGTLKAESWLTRVEDWCEALPRSKRPDGLDEWRDTQQLTGVPPRDLPLRQKVGRGIGWTSTTFAFDVPAVGEGGSFHFEAEAPEGLQIRRASLTAEVDGKTADRTVQRGVRNLQRVHLYLGNVPAGAWGAANVSLKPRASTMIRGAALAALLIALGLGVSWLFFLDQLRTTKDTGPAAAILLVVPGLLAVNAGRANEHPLTNSLVFGIRLLILLSGACSVVAAALLVAGQHLHAFTLIWGILTIVAVLVFGLLIEAWRLAARRRPSGGIP